MSKFHPTQRERLKAALLSGRYITKQLCHMELGIENVGARIMELRREGVPIATVWLDKDTLRPIYDWKLQRWRAYFGDGSAETQQPANAIAGYHLCCKQCGRFYPCDLGWRLDRQGAWYFGEYALTWLCPPCLADMRGDHETSDVPSPAKRASMTRDA